MRSPQQGLFLGTGRAPLRLRRLVLESGGALAGSAASCVEGECLDWEFASHLVLPRASLFAGQQECQGDPPWFLSLPALGAGAARSLGPQSSAGSRWDFRVSLSFPVCQLLETLLLLKPTTPLFHQKALRSPSHWNWRFLWGSVCGQFWGDSCLCSVYD